MHNWTRAEDLPNLRNLPDGSYSGSDRSCSVTVLVAGAADDGVVHLAADWRGRVDAAGLEDAVVEAFQDAANKRLAAWATTPPDPSLWSRHRQRVHATARVVAATSPPVPDDVRALHPDLDVGPGELLAAAVRSQRALACAEPRQASRRAIPVVVASGCGRVRMTLRAGRLTAVALDRAWTSVCGNTALEEALGDCLRTALEAVTAHTQPDPDVTACVDDLMARSLASGWEGARRKEVAPLPAVDEDVWIDHIAQVLVALSPTPGPWQLVAAGHLQRAADLITHQLPPSSAFSFGGGSVSRSYATLQTTLVALLRDGARTFTNAADACPTRLKIADPAEDISAAAHGDHVIDGQAARSSRAAARPASPPAGPQGPTVGDLCGLLRAGLDRCRRHLQAVTSSIGSVVDRTPASGEVVRDELADLHSRFDEACTRIDTVLAAPGDPDVLRETAGQWTRALSDQVCTLTGTVSRRSRGDQPTGSGADIQHAEAVAALIIASIGDELEAALIDLSDAITVFWAAVAATVSAVEILLTVAVALAASPLGAPTALTLTTNAVLRVSGSTKLDAVMLAMTDTAIGDRLSAASARLVEHTGRRHNR